MVCNTCTAGAKGPGAVDNWSRYFATTSTLMVASTPSKSVAVTRRAADLFQVLGKRNRVAVK